MSELGRVRIAITRALPGLGDFLCLTPALRSLRAALPSAEITLVGLASSAALVRRFDAYIDELLPFPGFPGIPETPVDVRALPPFLAAAQARRFDLALQMHGNGSLMNPFTVLLGAAAVAGYHAPGAYCPDPARYLPLSEDAHEVRRWLRLLAHLGIPLQGEALEFPLWPADWHALAQLPESDLLLAGEHVVLHPGAVDPARRWSPEHFAAVGDQLAAQGLTVVLTGTTHEALVVEAVARQMRWPALNLAGRTDLGALAALLSRARLLVTNDTGVSHLAAALRVPSVVVFLASDPCRWAPLDRELHRIVGANGLRPNDIAPEHALQHATALLRAPRLPVEQPGIPVGVDWPRRRAEVVGA